MIDYRSFQDIEQQIITLPLKKHEYPFLVRYQTSSYAKSSCSWVHGHKRKDRRGAESAKDNNGNVS